jgi:hypothetical protein
MGCEVDSNFSCVMVVHKTPSVPQAVGCLKPTLALEVDSYDHDMRAFSAICSYIDDHDTLMMMI